jgi:hypothetical protein
VAALAVLAAGCGDDDDDQAGDDAITTTSDVDGAAVNTTTTEVDLQWAASWGEATSWDPLGTDPLPIDEFNDLIDTSEAVFDVEDLQLLTSTFLRLDAIDELGTEGVRDDVEIDLTTEELDGDRVQVNATLTGLGDDSIDARRYEVVWEAVPEGYRLVDGQVTVRCVEGRGHQDFSPEPCL